MSPTYRGYVEKAINLHEGERTKAQCRPLKLQGVTLVEVLSPPKYKMLRNRATIVAGAWVVRAAMDQCGRTVTRRLLIQTAEPGNLRQIALLPGAFAGNFQLELDAMRIVRPALMLKAHCKIPKKLVFMDVKSLTPAGPKGWTETWTARACGKPVKVTVTYTADATGMQITAK
ncbi:hypothetical protein [Breoghania sp. L-A4]|uniref:hypothetical protein n=1 Tax=Breoghania sp. L-A4 TaxID=2304600 RepID=UPI000E35FE11|nr:hypothetical protein [Breoghania sp. L-A4]AXS40365.1 hypothetical protein D1F64_10210 [Breoghania sp. L-A4]